MIPGMSPSDEADFRALVRMARSNRNTPQGRAATSPGIDTVHDTAPEVYIARTPIHGIPALNEGSATGTGTGTSDSDVAGDVPGYADCQIWQLTDIEATTPTFEKVDFDPFRVYNLSTSAIDGDIWVIIKREKYGSWWVETGAGGGSGAVNVCGNPDAFDSNASGTGTDTTAGCPVRSRTEVLTEDVETLKFEAINFQVTTYTHGECGNGTGTGTGAGADTGKTVLIKTAGATAEISFGRGDPIICEVTCLVIETLRYLCVVDGLVQGYYDGVEANDQCGT